MRTIFMGASQSIVKWAYADVINEPHIEYCEFGYHEKAGIKKYLLSNRLGKMLPFICKELIYPRCFQWDFFKSAQRDEEILFLVTCQFNLFFDTFFETFILFLKRFYPKAKFVFYYNDIVTSCFPECIEMIKQEFDLVLTFDEADAQKYGIQYYGEIYSKNPIISDDKIEPFDVLFVGSDRGRFDTIFKLFQILADANLKSVFYVVDLLPQNKRTLEESFHDAISAESGEVRYKNAIMHFNEYCPYPKTLALIEKCKCMAEVLLPEQTAGSLRLPESISYKRKLITNCKIVKSRPYYSDQNILVFSNESMPNRECVKNFIDSPFVPIEYDFSPLKMIEYAQHKLF